MSSTTSANMSLVIPGVGTQNGPQYAFDVNASLTLIDQHDHSTGKGVAITPAGLNINVDLSFQANSAADVLNVVFTAQNSASTVPQSLSVSGGGESPEQQDLFFTPDTGIPIQLTKNGSINATASSLPGESYASGTFFWTQEQDALPTTPANFDIGSITLRPNVALTTYGVTLQPPAAIASQYSINLPALPVSQKIMTLDASGNMTAPYTVDNSTIEVSANVIQVKNLGITAGKIGTDAVTTTKILNEAVTLAKLAPDVIALFGMTVQVFDASGTYTKPAGLRQAFVIITGRGGNGGGITTGINVSSAGGGGGGATVMSLLDESVIAATETVTLPTSGSSASTFGALLSAAAGSAASTSGADATSNGASGATASGGNININGGDGSAGINGSGPVTSTGGLGGSSFWGGGGKGGQTTSGTSTGTNGKAPGSGGGGTAHVNSGVSSTSAGATGICVVIEMY